MNAHAIDAAFVQTGSELANVEPSAPPVSWTPSFAVAVDDAIERKREKRRFFEEVMDRDLHYGVIPGTGTKPTLFKPGAEMLLSNMGLNASFFDAEPPVVDVLGADHNGEPFIHYRRVCRIYRQLGPTEAQRMIVAEAAGSCSSWEPKYRYRLDQRRCPECGKAAVIKGKEEYGGGFICFKKKDGCGAKFRDNDPAITGQAVGKIANPDVADVENTILKMADKRALVAATLIATGCSDIFTQDVEDSAEPPESATEQPHAAPQPRARAPRKNDAPAQVPVHELQQLAAAANIESLGDWLVDTVAPDLYDRPKRVLTADETVRAKDLLLMEVTAYEAHASKAPADREPTAKQRAMLFKIHNDLGHTDADRHALYLGRFRKKSFTELTSDEVSALIDSFGSR